jgi:hypothetical protein
MHGNRILFITRFLLMVYYLDNHVMSPVMGLFKSSTWPYELSIFTCGEEPLHQSYEKIWQAFSSRYSDIAIFLGEEKYMLWQLDAKGEKSQLVTHSVNSYQCLLPNLVAYRPDNLPLLMALRATGRKTDGSIMKWPPTMQAVVDVVDIQHNNFFDESNPNPVIDCTLILGEYLVSAPFNHELVLDRMDHDTITRLDQLTLSSHVESSGRNHLFVLNREEMIFVYLSYKHTDQAVTWIRITESRKLVVVQHVLADCFVCEKATPRGNFQVGQIAIIAPNGLFRVHEKKLYYDSWPSRLSTDSLTCTGLPLVLLPMILDYYERQPWRIV